MPNALKVAALSPSLKKPDADFKEFSNFSNLTLISKIIEKAVAEQLEFTRRTSQVRVASQVRVTSQVPIFFFIFFSRLFDDDVRTVTRNINFPVGDIFHSRSKEPLPLHIAVASPRYTRQLSILFSKNIKA